MKRAGAVAFAILMLASMVALPLGGALATAGASTGGPEGMLALGDAQIEEDVPADADLPISASDLEGAVYASDHADTLQLVLTTPEIADDHLGENATVVANGDVAIVLSDDTVHEGREVAVDTDVLEAGVGFLPSVAYGTHESGEEWQSSIAVADGVASWSVPEFSSNSVTFTGGIELSGAEAGDGTTYEYDLDTLDGVGEYEIDVTGVETTEPAATSGTLGGGESLGIDVGGTADPRDEELTLTGIETTEPGSESLGAVPDGTSETIDVGGNQEPRDESVTLTGVETTASGSTSLGTVSSGASETISVGGNLDARDESVTLTGVETTASGSTSLGTVSSGTSETISVGGNLDARDESVTFQGVKNTDGQTNDGSGYGTHSINIDGNADPEGAELSITGSEYVDSRDKSQSIHDIERTLTWDESELPEYIDRIRLDIDHTRGTGVSEEYDIRFEDGDRNYLGQESGEIGQGGETVVEELVSIDGSDELRIIFYETSYDQLRLQGIEFDTGEPSGVEATVNGDTTSYGSLDDGETRSESVTGLNTGSNNIEITGEGGDIDWEIEYSEVTKTEDPSVEVGSETVTHDGVLDDGETVDLSGGNLSPGTEIIDVSTASGSEADVAASWTEVTATEDPSIDLGSEAVTHDGILTDGETIELSGGDLSSGSNSVDVSTAGGSDVTVDASWTEVTTTEDVTVDAGSDTVTHDGLLKPGETTELGTDLSTGSNTLDVSTGGGSEVDVATDWTEVTATEDPSVSIGDSTVSHTGVLEPGETVSDSVTLATGADSIDVDTGGEVSVDASWTEVTESVDPTISVNGYTTEYEGTLAAGETESLATNEGWLEEGTNTVTVSTDSPEIGPESLVGFEYAHDASGTTRSVDVEATSWTETFNVSHTYPSETADAEATLTFVDSVAEINDVEYRIDGGEWQPANASSLDGTDLTVEFGDVAADTEIDVRATGHKIRTYDGEVDVIEPTVEGDELATEVEITDITEDGIFGLRVDETVLGDRVHYASEQSWPGADAHAEVTASGTQIIRAPDANVGSTMTVESSSLVVEPETGAIEAVMEDAGEEPRFQLRQGDTVGTDAVDVTFYDTLSGERYVLWSETREVEVDADRATSPVTFTTDGSAETYSVLQRDASAGEEAAGAPTDTRSTLPLLLSFGGIGVVLVGTTLVGLRLDTGGRLLPITATSLTAIAIHVLAPTSPIERVAVLAYQSDVAAVAAVGLLLVGLWQLDERTEGEVPWYIRGVVGVLSVVWALETISPGVVLGGLREGVSTMGPLLVAALVLGGGYLARETLRARRADARTPDEQTTIEVRGFGEDGD